METVTRDRLRRRTAWAGAAAVLALLALTGCTRQTDNLSFEMHVFSAERPFVETFKAMDSDAAKLDCSVSSGADTVYSLTRYQWARLNALALRGKEVQRTFHDTQRMNDVEEFQRKVSTSDERTVDVAVMVVPESCCTFTLQHVGYTLHDAGGQTGIDFSCMYPIINNILVELPPTVAGGRYTWILMDIEKVGPDEPAAQH